MEIIKLIALLIGSVLLFTCCCSTSEPNLSYQQKPFRSHISWKTEDVSFIGILTSIPQSSSEENPARKLTLEFTSPESLCGIKVSQIGENTKVSLDDLEISDPYASRWLEVARLFDIRANVKESSVSELDGVSLNYIKAVSDDGQEFSLYLFPNSGLPRRICGQVNGSHCTLDIISFEFIPE